MEDTNIKLPTNYQQFIHLSRYARWNEENQRRETWNETVSRYFDFFEKHLKENNNLSKPQFDETRKYLESCTVLKHYAKYESINVCRISFRKR